jgi:NitT/TauT family transport system substrate-binding protein
MKQWMKKSLAACLALVMCLTLAACGGKEGETPAEESVNVRVAALKGPTAMGMVKLMSDYAPVEEALEDKENVVTAGGGNTYEFTLAASADEVSPKLMQGELDIACVPANLASVLYNRTDGGIVTLAVNTLGVLYIVENGNSVQSMADLAGRTIVASGKGSTPEYALRYLLTENGIDPDTGVTIDWKSEHSECVASLASGAATIAMLPQPFVTVAQTQLPDLRVALDLTEEWDALDNGSALLTGVVVARADFVKEHPAAVSNFLEQYSASVDWVNANTAEAAELIGGYDIVDATVAEKALPYCNIVCVTGTEMMDMLSGYLSVLWEQDGMPFIGKADIAGIRIDRKGNAVELGWTSLNDKATATVYAARSNNFKQGSPDRWVKVGKVKAGAGSFTYDLSANPDGFYKFAVVTPNNHLTCWAPAK